MVSRPEMAAVLEIHLARRNDPDLDREVGPSTRRFDRRVRLWGHFILRAAGIDNDKAYQSLQLLNNAVTRGLTVEYIRNPDMNLIDRSIATWKAQMPQTQSRSEEHTSELQSLMRISYAVFCLKKKTQNTNTFSTQNNVITNMINNKHSTCHDKQNMTNQFT